MTLAASVTSLLIQISATNIPVVQRKIASGLAGSVEDEKTQINRIRNDFAYRLCTASVLY